MLKIWGRTNSVNVKKVLWAAEELGLKYERVDAGMQFGVNKTPEYLKMNPTGLVPTIEDDGFAPATLAELTRRGHRIVTVDDYNQFGSAQMMWKLDGGYLAVSDPRRDGQAVGF